MKRAKEKEDATSLSPPKLLLGAVLVFFLILISQGVGVVGEPENVILQKTDSSPGVKVIDASAILDVSQIGEIPVGQIPDERITISLSIVNTGNEKVSGLRIKTFLVKEGREDTISSQLGSDFRGAELEPGEVKNIKNNYMVSKSLKPGNYKVLIRIDADAADKEKLSKYIEFVGNNIIKIGAYADAQGAIPVYSPSTIETPGSYLIMRDIDGGDRNNIMKLSASGITIDGGGHVIKGSSSGFTSGIYVDGGTILKDVHIRNCIFEGVDFGVWFYRVESGSIQNCTLKNCKNIGIRMDQARLNTVSDNTLTDNVLGIGLFQSAGNIVTNNFFKNQFNAAANDDQRNTWSTDIQNTRNIVGGQLKGGNVWLDLNGSGFSTSTPDGNHDGIADAPYTINGYNIDFFPLTISGSQVSGPQSTLITSDPVYELIPEESEQSPNVSIPNIQEENRGVAIISQNGSGNPPESQINITLSNSGNADISIIDLSVPENACIAGEFPVNITIENQGDLDAKYFSVYYYLSDDSGITPSDISLGSHLFEIIHPQEKLEVQDVLTVPQGTAVKAYTVGAIADPANDIYEKNKQNNILAVTHRIQMKTC